MCVCQILNFINKTKMLYMLECAIYARMQTLGIFLQNSGKCTGIMRKVSGRK